jgi:hypothetical protein
MSRNLQLRKLQEIFNSGKLQEIPTSGSYKKFSTPGNCKKFLLPVATRNFYFQKLQEVFNPEKLQEISTSGSHNKFFLKNCNPFSPKIPYFRKFSSGHFLTMFCLRTSQPQILQKKTHNVGHVQEITVHVLVELFPVQHIQVVLIALGGGLIYPVW